jgi:AraC-like DNA-binding protein
MGAGANPVMPAIPLPFIIALMLAILLLRLASQRDKALRPAMLFIAVCTALVTLVGLRWSLDLPYIRLLQPVFASLLPPTAWLAFAGLRGNKTAALWLHGIPTAVCALLAATTSHWHPPFDLLLALQYFGYGAALFWLWLGGADSMGAARLSDVMMARHATLIGAAVLIFSALADLIIAADFDFNQGSHAPAIVGVVSLIMLPLICYAVIIVGNTVTAPEVQIPLSPKVSLVEDAEVLAAIDRLMRDKKLFLDPDLTLNRIARRAAIPARQISGAINRHYGRNVSQVINEYRVNDAKRLLTTTDMPITSLMFEVGFQTKSNFNREFSRVTGTSPSDYRRLNSDLGGKTV